MGAGHQKRLELFYQGVGSMRLLVAKYINPYMQRTLGPLHLTLFPTACREMHRGPGDRTCQPSWEVSKKVRPGQSGSLHGAMSITYMSFYADTGDHQLCSLATSDS